MTPIYTNLRVAQPTSTFWWHHVEQILTLMVIYWQIRLQPLVAWPKVWPNRHPKLVAPRGTCTQPLVACGRHDIHFLPYFQYSNRRNRWCTLVHSHSAHASLWLARSFSRKCQSFPIRPHLVHILHTFCTHSAHILHPTFRDIPRHFQTSELRTQANS